MTAGGGSDQAPTDPQDGRLAVAAAAPRLAASVFRRAVCVPLELCLDELCRCIDCACVLISFIFVVVETRLAGSLHMRYPDKKMQLPCYETSGTRTIFPGP
jgi:hypothetical protein